MSDAPVTVGIDIGTSSVKAIAADDDGNVVARARVPHQFRVPTPGPLRARRRSRRGATVRGPRSPRSRPRSTAPRARRERRGDGAVAHRGRRRRRARCSRACSTATSAGALPSGERREPGGERRAAQLRALDGASRRPTPPGSGPRRRSPTTRSRGEAVLDTSTAATAYPAVRLHRLGRRRSCRGVGARVEQFPRLVPTGGSAARMRATGSDGRRRSASGCIDALAEQLVAGADNDGDVLVILGTTLIVWAVTDERRRRYPGYWTIPHTAAGEAARRRTEQRGRAVLRLGDAPARRHRRAGASPGRVPVWAPYPRGERTPLHDPDRRARARRPRPHPRRGRGPPRRVRGVGVRHPPGARRRARAHRRRRRAGSSRPAAASWSTSGCRPSPTPPGSRSTVWRVPEGGALGSAWLARIAAGLEEPMAMTEGRRWARVGRTVEPDPAWVEPVARTVRALPRELSRQLRRERAGAGCPGFRT